ncbi:D-ribose pyranase [Endozoicomonas sp. (ex Bugula neritina AB1)]|nr:D-ribose pyranase [Endozoicomonas sp. (ex Bugula neritina AB1)]
MKKGTLLHPQLSQVIATLGHGQGLTIGDCGLPIGESVERIDLALTHGVPSFLDTLNVVLTETCVEQVVIAEELENVSPDMYARLITRIECLAEEQRKAVEVIKVPHETFKIQAEQSRAVVRTGECTPYANIILKSGVVF